MGSEMCIRDRVGAAAIKILTESSPTAGAAKKRAQQSVLLQIMHAFRGWSWSCRGHGVASKEDGLSYFLLLGSEHIVLLIFASHLKSTRGWCGQLLDPFHNINMEAGLCAVLEIIVT